MADARRQTSDRGPDQEGSSASGAWLELAVSADAEAVEAVSEILSRVALGGVSVEPAYELETEGFGARVDVARPARVRGYLPAADRAAGRAAVGQVREALGHLQAFDLRPIGELETRLVLEEDWASAWKDHLAVQRIGRRLVIRPTWRRFRPRSGDVVVVMDPGMAFGTGLHPTTRLCLEGMERWADRGYLGRGASEGRPRLLDVGCGSGILAIAGGLLGAVEVVGVDPDPIAIESTVRNGRRNRLGRRLVARPGSVPSGFGPFDLVVANLIASVLIDLAEALRGELVSGGHLLASGILLDREADVRRAFGSAGLELEGRADEGEWVLLEAVRR